MCVSDLSFPFPPLRTRTATPCLAYQPTGLGSVVDLIHRKSPVLLLDARERGCGPTTPDEREGATQQEWEANANVGLISLQAAFNDYDADLRSRWSQGACDMQIAGTIAFFHRVLSSDLGKGHAAARGQSTHISMSEAISSMESHREKGLKFTAKMQKVGAGDGVTGGAAAREAATAAATTLSKVVDTIMGGQVAQSFMRNFYIKLMLWKRTPYLSSQLFGPLTWEAVEPFVTERETVEGKGQIPRDSKEVARMKWLDEATAEGKARLVAMLMKSFPNKDIKLMATLAKDNPNNLYQLIFADARAQVHFAYRTGHLTISPKRMNNNLKQITLDTEPEPPPCSTLHVNESMIF